jgi:hypothetical protein
MKFARGPSLLCALAAVVLALALQISSGMYDERALALTTLSAALAVAAALWLRKGAPAEPGFAAQAILGAGCAFGLACQLFVNPTFYGDPRAFAGGFRWLALAALVLLSAYLCVHLRASLVRARFLLLLACFVAMGIAVLHASQRPWVDVWVYQQGGAEALRHGLNPYSVTYPNIYGNLTPKWLTSEVFVNGRIAAYPYPPLSALVDLPAHALFGDVRYALLALMVAAAWMLARAGQGVTGELAALFVLFQPRTFFVLEQAWTEPLVLACFAGCVLAIARGKGPLLAGAALGLLAASKQTSPFLVVPLAFALPPEGRTKKLLAGAVVAAALLLPFALWDVRGFLRGVVLWQFWQPFRDDSLSLSALAAHLRPANYGALSWLGLALALLVFALTLRRRTDLAQASAAAAAAWLVLLLLSKQAFCNYYWLGAGLLCAAAALRERQEA